jgi:ATP-dependent protease HslVU (ClpYQ) peptidase subunit
MEEYGISFMGTGSEGNFATSAPRAFWRNAAAAQVFAAHG